MLNEIVVRDLNYLCKTYDGLNKLIVSTKNRLASINPEAEAKHQDEIISLESFKGKIARRIEKNLEFFPVWSEWMKKVPGVGPYIGGNLVLLYYFKFTPVCECGQPVEKKEVGTPDGKTINTFWCPECLKSIKGDGVLKHAVHEKDFETISAWWAYCGRYPVDGKIPKRKKGVVSNWSALGRKLGFDFSEQVNRQKPDHLYKTFFLNAKKKRERTHPGDKEKGHRHNMAKNEVYKLFLAHFWTVARTLDGKKVTAPYVETIMGHTGILAPFYF
jgi:hypothetical protein